ncbi:Long-chain-fatty-acid--CoA ligase (EC [Olavius algarvensis associated proteobacterium Delta 3]|nr:Long-chain-fatty-acid--CoA ligase (EC [Olavius algarvensis associated proteobacterium Delta 3]
MALHDFTVYDLIRRNADTFGNAPAWFEADDGRTVTFAELREHVDRLAAGLRKKGIGKGDRIGILGQNSLEYFLVYGAAAALGAISLPINWRLSAEEVCFNLNDGEPTLVFVDGEYQELIDANRAALPSVQEFINLKPGIGGYVPFESLLEEGTARNREDVSGNDGFVIIHTAAVAGRPRGALLSHSNLLCSDMHLVYLFGTTPRDVHLNLLPLFHIAGLVMAFSSFHVGAMNLNMSRFDASRAVQLIAEKKASLMFDFSPILGSILEEAEKTGRDITPLRGVLGLEAPETIEKYQNVTGGTFYCMYGQTETSCLATLGRYNDRPGSAGKTIELAEVRLFDDYDQPVPVGQVGEICMRGPMVFNGYWNLPEDNAYTFREGWHHTGDLARFDEDGYLFYAGRSAEKELIKPGGENVYPAEVEKAILQHPAVESTVVFGVPDPRWKEGIKAVCRLRAGEQLDAAELIEFVGKRIARFKKPQYVEFVGALPLQDDGTPDRQKVKELYGGEQ